MKIDRDDIFAVGCILFVLYVIIYIVFLIGFTIYDGFRDEKEWNQFKIDHHCKLVAVKTNNHRVSWKEGWTCDDGVTYYR